MKDKDQLEAMRRDGVTGQQISRRILEMVGLLHARGFESLYIDPVMAPSGAYWRYEIGAMVNGCWPAWKCAQEAEAPKPVIGSIGGGYDQQIPWGKPTDSVETLTEGFTDSCSELLAQASVPNKDYAAWYREMLEQTSPEGVMIFMSDYGPSHEYAFCWGEPRDFRMAMPPGFTGD